MDPIQQTEVEPDRHSREPWTQEGRYIRDARGAIVVRGRTAADARRIVAAINATRDIPTEALESWLVQNVSDPTKRPNLEIDLDATDPGRSPYLVKPVDRRRTERRVKDRRGPYSMPPSEDPLFDRRVMERRLGDRRAGETAS